MTLSFANKTVFVLFVPAAYCWFPLRLYSLYDLLARRDADAAARRAAGARQGDRERVAAAARDQGRDPRDSALTAIMLAVARPQIEARRAVEVHGLDLVVAVDVSKSMLVDDVGATGAAMTEAEDVGLGGLRARASSRSR